MYTFARNVRSSPFVEIKQIEITFFLNSALYKLVSEMGSTPTRRKSGNLRGKFRNLETLHCPQVNCDIKIVPHFERYLLYNFAALIVNLKHVHGTSER